MKKFFLLISSMLAFSGVWDVRGDWGPADYYSWYSCWAGDPSSIRRVIRYPQPISVQIRNRSHRTWTLCVFDEKCPFTLFKGKIPQNYSILVGACANEDGLGSISIMNSLGQFWRYSNTGNRTITID